MLAAKGIVRASDEAYDRSKVHRDLAKRGVDSGLRSPIELTRAEADLARFDVDRVRSRGGLAIAQTVLGAAIGAPDTRNRHVERSTGAGDMPALPDALQRAQAHDPAMAAAIADLKAAERGPRAVGAELRPDLLLTGTISGRAGGAPATGGVADAPGRRLPSDVPNWDVGVRPVLAPLRRGHRRQADAARAVEQVRRDDIDVTREQDGRARRRTFAQVQVSRNGHRRAAEPGGRRARQLQSGRCPLPAGIGNAVELADAEAVRTDADIQLAIGQFNLARDRAAFGRAIAEGL